MEEGIKPDAITFVSILNACTHVGMLDKGQVYYEVMSKDYGITPMFEHHTCMVLVFGSRGNFDKALLIALQSCDHLEVWVALLGGCRKWGNVQLGRHAFEQVLFLHENDVAAHICMHNIYADFEVRE